MVELAATNIAFNINMLAFMPMMGFGTAISVLVGQKLGMDKPDLAERGIYSGLHMCLVYFLVVDLLYVFTPGLFIWPVTAGMRATVSFGSRLASRIPTTCAPTWTRRFDDLAANDQSTLSICAICDISDICDICG